MKYILLMFILLTFGSFGIDIAYSVTMPGYLDGDSTAGKMVFLACFIGLGGTVLSGLACLAYYWDER